MRIAPQPNNWKPDGGSVTASQIYLDEAARNDSAIIALKHLAKRRLWDLPISSANDAEVDSTMLTLNLLNEPLLNDSYRLKITKQSIEITAGSYGGRFYAGITLLTLLKTYNSELPCGTIEDRPRYEWRGQHLDTARHFYRTETIFDLLDLMALMKLNRFHWHFSDDEAFRLQLDCCPELWKKTEYRGENHLLPALFSDAVESGGSYSKTEVRALVAHAKELNIEILPEVETISHALAIAKVYPGTRDPNDTGKERSVQGYTANVLNPAMPETWTVLNNIVTEVGELFPFNHILLGCDELPEQTWNGSPRAQALMQKEGLNNTDDLLGWTMSRLASTVVANGQRPAAWEEATKGSNGGIGNNAIVFSWTGQGPGLAAARAGYDVVMCPAQNVYLDMAHTDDIDDWGANWAAYIELEDTVNWEVCPDSLVAERIIGVQGEFWSEFTTSDEQMWPMLLPRIVGVACKAWQTQHIDTECLRAIAYHYDPMALNLLPSS